MDTRKQESTLNSYIDHNTSIYVVRTYLQPRQLLFLAFIRIFLHFKYPKPYFMLNVSLDVCLVFLDYIDPNYITIACVVSLPSSVGILSLIF